VIWCEWYNSTLHDGDGRLVSVLSFVLDVTERTRASAALREASERLRDADRRKDEFLAMLSHELRNPLAPIRNSVQILKRAPPDGDAARRAHVVVERQVDHVTKLVDDLLDVTRIARGKIELERETLDLCEVARRTVEDLASVLEARQVRLHARIPREAAWVKADPTRIAQVIGNLLQNAAKFTPAGGEVLVEVAASEGRVDVRVRDTGVGIPPEMLRDVFEPFVQAKQPLARSHGGLGLGLALVKGVVELHGGAVRAASAGEGKGAEFTVTLPLAPAPARPATAPCEGRPARVQRVLVVDDNVDAAETLADLVRLLGHDPDVAFDAPSALERVRSSRPNVVLCDIGLPGVTGYELARRLRQEGFTTVRMVAVTGYAAPEDRKRAADAGFDDHVAKPPDLDELARVLS
jgi:CheY-like chemotaxis protein